MYSVLQFLHIVFVCVCVCVSVPYCFQCSDGLWKKVPKSVFSGSDGPVKSARESQVEQVMCKMGAVSCDRLSSAEAVE